MTNHTVGVINVTHPMVISMAPGAVPGPMLTIMITLSMMSMMIIIITIITIAITHMVTDMVTITAITFTDNTSAAMLVTKTRLQATVMTEDMDIIILIVIIATVDMVTATDILLFKLLPAMLVMESTMTT